MRPTPGGSIICASTPKQLEPYKRALALDRRNDDRRLRALFQRTDAHVAPAVLVAGRVSSHARLSAGAEDNAMRNQSTNQDVRNFVAERHHTDLLFLRLPVPVTQTTTARDPIVTWREEWLRGGDDFWLDLERARGARLGSRVQSKQQYLGFVEDSTAHGVAHSRLGHRAHGEWISFRVKSWLRRLARVRKVSSIYSKDFSDMLGCRASLIVATS